MRDRRARAWGIASTIAASVGLLPIAVLLFLTVALSYMWGALLLAVLPFSLAMVMVAAVFGLIGLVAARRIRGEYGWSLVGLGLGVGQILLVVAWVSSSLA